MWYVLSSNTLIPVADVIRYIDADTALKILGKSATWRERQVLGSVKYLWDVTITHNDVDYMKKVRPFSKLVSPFDP